ncbi:hypothetical protein EYD45_13970 [Hyunsoonleella flava]|uniref:Uncharacterized protein n=1 Tax=Hyunsoonleella flava TaxID=2527939 RepID=A0A4Q9FDN7_9FLAO|nr:hypothetical protein [Hyunsoonleella flava]TBN00925.1 hypothetical protein EYD45_13970 [Hyunsoonleella flava]
MRTETKLSKIISIFIILLSYLNVQGQKSIGEIKIEEKQKNVSNLSGALNDSISFHIIINKVKKEYKSEIYFYNKSEQTKLIKLYKGPEKPIYVTFHVNDNNLTLIKESQNLSIIQDVNYLTEVTSSKPIYLKPENIFSHKNRTFLIDEIKDRTRKIIQIKSVEDIKITSYKAKNFFQLNLLNAISTDKTEFVNDLQFVEKGSIKTYKAFYSNGNLVFVIDNKKVGEINLVYFNESGDIRNQKIAIEESKKIKKMNSFIKDNFLFTFYMNKELAYLLIHDVKTEKLVSEFKYDINSFGLYNKVIINGKVSNNSFNTKKFFKSFFPQAIGSTYNAELYLGVNKSTNGDYIVQIGHVDKNTYHNRSGNNYWWNYPAFGFNYNLSNGNTSVGFNPGAMSMVIFEALSDNKRKGNYFELNLDSNFNHVGDTINPEYTSLLKSEEYIKRINITMKLKKHFFIPLKYSVRMINFNNKKESYEIFDYPIIK